MNEKTATKAMGHPVVGRWAARFAILSLTISPIASAGDPPASATDVLEAQTGQVVAVLERVKVSCAFPRAFEADSFALPSGAAEIAIQDVTLGTPVRPVGAIDPGLVLPELQGSARLRAFVLPNGDFSEVELIDGFPGGDALLDAIVADLARTRMAPPPEELHGRSVVVEAAIFVEVTSEASRAASRTAQEEPKASAWRSAEAWFEAFQAAYTLEHDEVLRLIRHPSRIPYLDQLAKRTNVDERPAQMAIQVDDTGAFLPQETSWCFGGCDSVANLAKSIGFADHLVVGDRSIPGLRIPYDLVLRHGAATVDLAAALAKEIARATGEHLRIELRETLRPTIIASGRLGTVAPDPAFDGRTTVHIFLDEKDPTPHFLPETGKPLVTAMLDRISQILATPVIDQLDTRDERTYMLSHHSALLTTQIRRVLDNVEAQTELRFAIEERPITTLHLARGGDR